jgi:hypothetical protein
MGWSFSAKPQNEDAELAGDYTGNGNRILASRICKSVAGNSAVWYAVLQTTQSGRPGDEPLATPIRIALVVLIDRRGRAPYPWGTKSMDETAGPNEDAMPLHMLRMLSPIEELEVAMGHRLDYARAWRERCEARAFPKITMAPLGFPGFAGTHVIGGKPAR